MSIIVAVRKNDRIIMAADSLTTFGESQRVPPANVTTEKIRRVGSSLVGGSGWGIYDRILDAFLADAAGVGFHDAFVGDAVDHALELLS